MKTREFKLRKAIRRGGVITALGFLSIPLLQIAIGWALDSPSASGWSKLCVMAPIMAPLLFWAYWVRLRVDDRGISLRITVGWFQWTWEDFECGRVDLGEYRNQYVRVPPRRNEPSLLLGLFGNDAVALCDPLIAQHIRPAPIAIPDEMVVGYPKVGPKRTEAYMDPSGIRLTRQGEKEFFPWSEVERVVAETVTTEHRDFLSLRIQLPQRSVVLRVNPKKRRPMYSGPKPKVVRAFLERLIPKERWVVAPHCGHPKTREALEVEKQRAALQRRNAKMAKWAIAFWIPIALVLWLLITRDEPHPDIRFGVPLVSLVLFFILLVPIQRFADRIYRRRERELDEAEKQLGAEEKEDESGISSER